MFENQLGLRENPFAAGHHPRFVYPSHEHQEALAHLRYGIENREPFVLITGEVGTGKTTAIYDALASWGTSAIVALINNSALTRTELLEEIGLRFGISLPAPASKPQLLTALELRLLEIHASGEYAILLLDEAQNLDRDLLEEIRLLSNLERDGQKLVQIFLVGQPELEAKLTRPELRQLRQRIVIHYRLHPLSEDDTAHYIHHRVSVAGGNATELFPPSSCSEIHRLTHGIPREINTIAGQALINAFVEDSTVVRPEHVRSVAEETEFRSVLDAQAPAVQGNGPSRAERPERDPVVPPTAEIELPPAKPEVEIPQQPPEVEPPPTGPGIDDPAKTPEIDVPPTRPEIRAPAPAEPGPQPPPIKAASIPSAPSATPGASGTPEGLQMPAWLEQAIARANPEAAAPTTYGTATAGTSEAAAPAGASAPPWAQESVAPQEEWPSELDPPAGEDWSAASQLAQAAQADSTRFKLQIESRPDPWLPKPGGGVVPDFLSPRLREKLAAAEMEAGEAGEPMRRPTNYLPWMVSGGLLAAAVIALVLAVRFGAPVPFLGGQRDSIEEPAQETAPAVLADTSQISLPSAVVPEPTPPPRVEAPKATARPAPAKQSPVPRPTAHATNPTIGLPPPPPKPPPQRFGIDVGTYLNEERAATERQRLNAATSFASRVLTITEDSVALYRIVIGSFQDREEAERAASDLIRRGLVNEARVVAIATSER